MEESLFVLAKDPVLAAGAGGIGSLVVNIHNRTDGAEANDALNLLSGCTSNLCLEDMAEIRRQGITIDDNNDPEPYKFPRQGKTTTGTRFSGS